VDSDDHKRSLTFIDLYAGCGGLSLGLMNAGWKGCFAVEKDSLAFETLKHNLLADEGKHRYDWPKWLPREPIAIGKFAKTFHDQLKALRGKVTLIAGGPPCQGFSMAGRRKKNDPRNKLFQHYVEIVSLVKPPFLLLENVRGIAVAFDQKKKRGPGRPPVPFSLKIKKKLESLGYAVYPQPLRAAHFGVAQHRPRYFMVAVEKNLLDGLKNFDPFEELEAIREKFLLEKGLPLDREISVEEALSDLETAGRDLVECVDSKGFKQITYERPKTKYQELLHGSMNGTPPNSLRLARHRPDIVERFGGILAQCRRGVQLNDQDRERLGLKKHCIVPLDAKKPSHTLTTLPDDYLHYKEPRILSVREYARLQSFPDWYAFKGKYTTGGDRRKNECPRYTQVGNAVPPFVGDCIGRLLASLASELTVESVGKGV
jgi:DNA (cytosine-5)-methyltransferase 1